MEIVSAIKTKKDNTNKTWHGKVKLINSSRE